MSVVEIGTMLIAIAGPLLALLVKKLDNLKLSEDFQRGMATAERTAGRVGKPLMTATIVVITIGVVAYMVSDTIQYIKSMPRNATLSQPVPKGWFGQLLGTLRDLLDWTWGTVTKAWLWISSSDLRSAAFGIAILLLIVWVKRRQVVSFVSRLGPATQVLSGFSLLVIIFATAALVHYRALLNADLVFLAVGLLFAMMFGMFVHVLVSNRKENRPIFEVSRSQLIFPLLFSPLVYYPIWAAASNHPSSFSVYAAFLNGYFWEHVVSSVKPLTLAPSSQGTAQSGASRAQRKSTSD
jgi:hypothetical protein